MKLGACKNLDAKLVMNSWLNLNNLVIIWKEVVKRWCFLVCFILIIIKVNEKKLQLPMGSNKTKERKEEREDEREVKQRTVASWSRRVRWSLSCAYSASM